jgi:hypothetical protein
MVKLLNWCFIKALQRDIHQVCQVLVMTWEWEDLGFRRSKIALWTWCLNPSEVEITSWFVSQVLWWPVCKFLNCLVQSFHEDHQLKWNPWSLWNTESASAHSQISPQQQRCCLVPSSLWMVGAEQQKCERHCQCWDSGADDVSVITFRSVLFWNAYSSPDWWIACQWASILLTI